MKHSLHFRPFSGNPCRPATSNPLVNIMAKTNSSTALAFWPGVFMATLGVSRSVAGHHHCTFHHLRHDLRHGDVTFSVSRVFRAIHLSTVVHLLCASLDDSLVAYSASSRAGVPQLAVRSLSLHYHALYSRVAFRLAVSTTGCCD